MGQPLNLLGLRFGRLIVVKRLGTDEHKRVLWLCRCDCGQEVVLPTRALRNQGVVSCGCHRELKAYKNLREQPPQEKFGLIDGTNLSKLRSSKPQKNNQLGVRGVMLLPSGRYRAYLYHKRHRIEAGVYDTLDQAKDAVATLREKLMSKYEEVDSHD